MPRRYFHFWLLFISLALIFPPNISAAFRQVENDQSYASDREPSGEIILAQRRDDWRRRQQIEQQRRIQAERRRRQQIEQQRRIQAERKQRQLEQQRRLEPQRKQRQLEQQRRLEAQRKQKQIEQQRRFEAQRKQKQLEQQRRLEPQRKRIQLEQQRRLEAQRKQRQLEQQRRLQAERRRWAIERQRQIEAGIAQRAIERQRHLEAERWRLAGEPERRLEEERLQREEERQRRLEEEKWQKEMERQDRLEEEKWRREEEREKRLEAARLKMEEEKWQKEMERQNRLEEEKWRREEEQRELKEKKPEQRRAEKKVDESSYPKVKVSSSWRAPKNTRILSVAVGNFKDASIQQVSNATSDAKHLASFARASGIPEENITLLTNEKATRSEIMDNLAKLKMATTEETETAILYFSGHGAPIMKNGKIVDSVIVPYDAKESSMEHTGIKISTLREVLSNVSGNWIVVLDSCFSGKPGRSLMPKDVKALAVVPRDFNVVSKSPKKTWWVTATSGDNYANSFQKKNLGLFTYYFTRALNGEEGVDADGDGLISLREAFTWTDSEVNAVSRKSLGRPQDPEIIGEGDAILTMPQ
ncbi:MAG: caspase family protein [Syntrophales bacterium]|nr:caspase family protein [Syntrophales bacterium]